MKALQSDKSIWIKDEDLSGFLVIHELTIVNNIISYFIIIHHEYRFYQRKRTGPGGYSG
jgi:hypothetical protein